MNGTILMELGKYVENRFDRESWESLLHEAGIASRLYVPIEDYPDQEAVTLVTAAATREGKPVGALLEDFGQFIVPAFIKMYGFLIDPKWKTIDLLANLEPAVLEVIRRSTTKSNPPRLKCERTGQEEVIIFYDSPRRLCAMAKGIVQGIANFYREPVMIAERACMFQGASHCEISVKLLGGVGTVRIP